MKAKEPKLGVAILATKPTRRLVELANFLTDQNCATYIHFDASSGIKPPADLKAPSYSKVKTGWGSFGLVEATIDLTQRILKEDREITHVALLSESCIPTKPIPELLRHLAKHPDTDFIDAKPIEDEDWIGDGLTDERLSLFHPFSYRDQRWLFDTNVKIQRWLGVNRNLPNAMKAHSGSQWWCLRKSTLEMLFNSSEFQSLKTFMRYSWIPDEHFFQTLLGTLVPSSIQPSLTFSEFDRIGKPYVFYDDHIEKLEHAPGFFARKIWPDADRVYDHFLTDKLKPSAPTPLQMRSFAHRPRRHIVNMGRHFDIRRRGYQIAERPFWVFVGFHQADANFGTNLNDQFGLSPFPRFFQRGGKRLGLSSGIGNLIQNPLHLRYNPHAHFSNLISATEGTPAFCLEPGDHHGLWTTILKSATANVVFLEDHWRGRVDTSSSALREERVRAVYQKLLDPKAFKMSRAKFHRISWASFEKQGLNAMSHIDMPRKQSLGG